MKRHKYLALIFIVYLFLWIFLPSNNGWMGDGYTIAHLHEYSIADIIADRGSYFIAVIPFTIIDYITVLPMTFMFGLIYIWFAYCLIRCGKTYIFLLAIPAIQVFIGYSEIYSAFYAFSLGFFYYAHKRRTRMAVIYFILCLLSHVYMSFPLGIIVFVSFKSKHRIILLAILITIAFVLCLMFRSIPILSLNDGYSLLNTTHLIEFLLLLTVFSIPILPNINKLKINRWTLTAFVAVIMMFIMPSDLGLFRDWDLAGMAALPLLMVGLQKMKKIHWPVFIVTAGITLCFLLFNNSNPQKTMLNYMKGHPAYRDTRTMHTTIFIYMNELQDTLSAIKLHNWREK